jgi:endonuclease/exonuclease/phosphatase (EEP) superfamily protein YafD
MYLTPKFINQITFLKLVKKLTYLTVAIISALTLISLLGRYPYLELSTHFRLQYAWISLICIVVLSFLRSCKLVLPITLCAFFNLAQIIPYYYAPERQIQDLPANTLKIMLANVEGSNKNYPALIQTVKSVNPDFLVLQEITDKWWSNIQVLTSVYPYFKAVPRPGGTGLAIFSRYPIEAAEVLFFDESTHPALYCKINLEGTLLAVLAIHPPTPMNPIKFAYRNGQFAQAASIMKTAAEPKLLIGDFNTTMWSPYFEALVKDSGLRDARLGKGLYPSWHAGLPPFMSIPIDHCLVGKKIDVNSIETGNNTGSDHRPLILNLRIEKQNAQARQ